MMIREKLPELEDLANDFLDEAKEKGSSDLGPRNLAQMTLKGKIKKEACDHCGKPGHHIRKCEDFLKEIRQQILDEMAIGDSQVQGKNHTAARAIGPLRGFSVMGIPHETYESTTAW
jgi:hypothetical protein